MTECVVICHQCVDDTGRAKRWDWLCEICAENCVTEHRRDAGHTDIELRVTTERSFTDVQDRIATRMAAGNAWRRNMIRRVR